MNKLLKFKQHPEQKVFFTADPHLYHQQSFIYEKRGYASSDEHVTGVVDKINSTVRENDILFILGDITLNCSQEQFTAILDRIVCKNIKMIWGNHNNPSYIFYKKQQEIQYNISSEICEIYPVSYKNLQFLGNYQEIVVDGQYIVLSHYPIHVFNWMGKGGVHVCGGDSLETAVLCGHSHGSFPLSQPSDTKAKILDVGWDVFGKPVDLNEIKQITAKKEILKVDHH